MILCTLCDSVHNAMNLITVDIAGFRGKLSDYITLVSMGKAVVSVVNGKSGKEVARLVSSVSSTEDIDARMRELKSLYGFASKLQVSLG